MRLMRNWTFWIICLSFAVCCLLHYIELTGIPGTALPSLHFGLTRHSLDRVLFLVPIIYSTFAFGRKGALITLAAALVAMLPRAILLSPTPGDALLETTGVLAMGFVASWGIWTRAQERDKTKAALAELHSAHETLQHYVQSARREARRRTILSTISALLSESLQLPKTLQRATHMVSELMEVEVTLIFSIDEESNKLKLVACEGVSEEFVRTVDGQELDKGFYGEVAKTRQPMVIDSGSHYAELTTPEISNMRIQTQLIVPMIVREQLRGVLCVAMRRPRQFTIEDIELLTGVGTQIGTAIENARLYEKEKLAAQRLAISERNFRQLFENASDAIWVHDLQGNITAANEATVRLVGYSATELKRINVRKFLSAESLNMASQVRRKLLENEPIEQPYEQRLIRKDGTEAILNLSTSLVTEDGKPVGFQHIARDVTGERKMQDRLRYYLSQITQVQEEERKRIARELHDDTSQALYALSRQVDNFTRGDLPEVSKETTAFMQELQAQLNSILQGIRRFTQELRPPMLDDLGLAATLRWQAGDLEKRSEMDVHLKITGNERRFLPENELIIFRIVQEALRNVEKHAKASKVEANIEFSDVSTKISITDNGRGFDSGNLAELPQKGKLGIAGMEERVRLLNGSIVIQSKPGRGTTVKIELPV